MKKEITFKELKASGYKDQSINEEIQSNLISRIKTKEPVFEGLWGYEDTVVPQLKKAILAGHHINLLGLRGQAKTKIAWKLLIYSSEPLSVFRNASIHLRIECDN